MNVHDLRSVVTGIVTFVVVCSATWGLCEWGKLRRDVAATPAMADSWAPTTGPFECSSRPVPAFPDCTVIGVTDMGNTLARIDIPRAVVLVPETDCLPREVLAWVWGPGPGEILLEAGAAIYGSDGQLICASQCADVPGDLNGWLHLPLIPGEALLAGNTYLVAVYVDDAMTCVASEEGTLGRSASALDFATGGWPGRIEFVEDGRDYSIACAIEPLPDDVVPPDEPLTEIWNQQDLRAGNDGL